MLSRSGVAKQLRCSLATVRRLEGRELYPWQDSRGVHRFDPEQVAVVARKIRRGEAPSARGPWVTNGHYSRVTPPVLLCAEAEPAKRQDEHEEVEALHLENAELRATLEHLCNEIDSLESELG